ncbi:hypothetical protein TB2_022832 [Malus domestica]
MQKAVAFCWVAEFVVLVMVIVLYNWKMLGKKILEGVQYGLDFVFPLFFSPLHDSSLHIYRWDNCAQSNCFGFGLNCCCFEFRGVLIVV